MYREKFVVSDADTPRPAASSTKRSRREGRLMVAPLLKPLSALSVASATSNLPPVRPAPDRAWRHATECEIRSTRPSVARGGRVLTPHPLSGREPQDVLIWLRRLTLFGVGFKLVRTPTPLHPREDPRRPATGATSGARIGHFRLPLGPAPMCSDRALANRTPDTDSPHTLLRRVAAPSAVV